MKVRIFDMVVFYENERRMLLFILFVIIWLAGTPAPHKFSIEKGFYDASFWEVEKSFTVVYVPASNTGEDEIELTNAKKSKYLASLKVRGNSSRNAPKKQFQIKFKDPLALIPNTPPAKKWILSAKLASWQPDKTYVGNPAVFSSYRRYGELQKKFSKSWPEEDSVEDFASRAWSPNTLPVNLVFQGRFVGVYNIMEKVEVLKHGGRVWMPDEVTTPEMDEIEGFKIPQGNYFLEQDTKLAAGVDYFEQGFQFPAHPEWVSQHIPSVIAAITGNKKLAKLPYASIPVLTIAYPDDVTFLEYNEDSESKDVSALRILLKQIMTWTEDPVANDEKLAQVIDMKSLARWYLSEEITREGDAYVVSQKWKFVKGKLYHASLWDFGGNSFMMTCNSNKKPGNTQYIDFDAMKALIIFTQLAGMLTVYIFWLVYSKKDILATKTTVQLFSIIADFIDIYFELPVYRKSFGRYLILFGHMALWMMLITRVWSLTKTSSILEV